MNNSAIMHVYSLKYRQSFIVIDSVMLLSVYLIVARADRFRKPWIFQKRRDKRERKKERERERERNKLGLSWQSIIIGWKFFCLLLDGRGWKVLPAYVCKCTRRRIINAYCIAKISLLLVPVCIDFDNFSTFQPINIQP